MNPDDMTTENLPPLPDEEDAILPPLEDAENLPPLPEEIPADTGDSSLPPLPPGTPLVQEPAVVLPQPLAPVGKNSSSKLPLILAAGLCLGGLGIYMVSSGSESSNVSSFSASIPTVSPDEAIEMLKRYGIIDQYATGDMVTTQRFTASNSHKGNAYLIKIISEDLLRHFAMYKDGVEKLNEYPYVDKIIELYRRTNTAQDELPAVDLIELYRKTDNTTHKEPLMEKKLPVQCLKAFTAKGCTIADFGACRSNVEGVYPQDKNIMKFIYFELCGASKHLLNTPDKDGLTPLMTAARFYSADICRQLINAGADVNARDNRAGSALMLSLYNTGNGDVVDVLLKAGADVNAKDNEDATPLIHAAAYGTTDACRKLIDAGADKNATIKGMNALMLAARSNTSEVCEKLISAGMDVNAETGETFPLLVAARNNSGDVCRTLIKNGANINAKNKKGETALMCSRHNYQNEDVTDVLIAAGADLNAQNDDGQTLLMQIFSARRRMDSLLQDTNIFEKLLLAGADVNVRDKDGYSVYTRAMRRNFRHDLVRKLQQAGGVIDAQNEVDQAVFLNICSQITENPSDKAFITGLIKEGANINTKDEDGNTALMKVIQQKKSPVICQLLIELGSDVNATNNDGYTPLMVAALDHHSDESYRYMDEIADILLQAGADVNIKDRAGHSMISRAINGYDYDEIKYLLDGSIHHRFVQKLLQSGCRIDSHDSVTQELFAKHYSRISKETLCDLIQAGANVNAKDAFGVTPLMRACGSEDADTCQKLIQLGADVNAQDERGYTPLMYASNNKEIIRILLNNGADVDIVNNEGRKAAENGGLVADVRKLLQSASQQGADESFSTTEYEGEYSNAGVQAEEDRSGLDPLIANMRALRCREATSQLYQKRLLTLLPLIRNGADVNVTLTETKGNTALHYACGIGSWSITLWLVEHGADVNAVTNAGKTPLDCVGEDNAKRIRELLISRGAKRSSELSASSYTYSAGNDAEELNNLGLAYQYGNNGKPQNYNEAARHFRLAAEQGHAGAQNNLGFCYHNGWGVPKDMSQAAMWYKRSADQGNAWGQSNYGTCLEFGWGVRKNVSAAIEMYRRAAAQGHASAKKHLKRHGITM